MHRKLSWLLLASACFYFVAVRGYTADDKSADDTKKEKSPDDAKDAKAKAATDRAVTSAFALKRGVTLRPDQQQAYDKLKQDEEPKLREALDKKAEVTADKTAKSKDKTAAANDVRKIIADIKKQMTAILTMAPPAPQQPQGQQQGPGRYPGRGRY